MPVCGNCLEDPGATIDAEAPDQPAWLCAVCADDRFGRGRWSPVASAPAEES